MFSFLRRLDLRDKLLSTRIEQAYKSHMRVYRSGRQGYGFDPLSPEQALDFPMVYGLIASAELSFSITTGNSRSFENAIGAADWLVRNADLNQNGLIGYGLPFEWDAFQNGSVNPKHTEYGITTALAVQGLLDTVDAIDCKFEQNMIHNGYHDKRKEYIEISRSALSSFIEKKLFNDYGNEGLCFWYSTRSEDAFDVNNVNSMLGGMLQRLSTYVDPDFSRSTQWIARRSIQYAINQIILSDAESVGWYWNYYGRKKPVGKKVQPNDLVHAAYTFDGIRNYYHYGGDLITQIELKELTKHILLYVDAKQRVVKRWADRKSEPKLWDIGYLLFLLSQFDDFIRAKVVFEYLQAVYLGNDAHYAYLPNDRRAFVRHEAHVALGLSAFVRGMQRRRGIK